MQKQLKLLPRVPETKPCVVCGRPIVVYRGRFGNLASVNKDTCSRACEYEKQFRDSLFFQTLD